jgi:hypothetical protein
MKQPICIHHLDDIIARRDNLRLRGETISTETRKLVDKKLHHVNPDIFALMRIIRKYPRSEYRIDRAEREIYSKLIAIDSWLKSVEQEHETH